MTWLHATLLGLLQGLTEFLPVSSTAHMDLVPQLFHQPDPGAAFSAVVQLGPIVAIIAYFRDEIGRYLAGVFRTKSPARIPPGDIDAKLGWFTLLGTIPLIIFGVLLEHRIDHQFRQLKVVAFSLIVLGIVLYLAERVGTRRKSLENMSLRQSQVIGWAQVLALVPGTSRSGVTITAGLFEGLDRESAARFSFLLSIPAISAAGLYKLLKVIKLFRTPGAATILATYLFAALVAGVFAYVVIRWFLGYMREHNTGIFIVYRIVLGAAVLLLLHQGVIADRTPSPAASMTTASTRPPISTLSAAAARSQAPRLGTF
ncbi:MAG TPA: undecaprenyl-diphosphatase UppP [Chthonomonadales bacterium]|nr:undecaprenyl-diphosphatase UppP [Chthonomonadales bacterium]